MTKFLLLTVLVISVLVLSADAFCGLSATAALAPRQALARQTLVIAPSPALPSPVLGRGGKRVSTTLHVDTQFIIGGGVALVGFGAGAAILALVERAGEKTMERGGLSEDAMTNFSGMFMEDTEQSTVSDVGGLAERLESALKKAGASSEEADLTEEEKAAKIAELDDGW